MRKAAKKGAATAAEEASRPGADDLLRAIVHGTREPPLFCWLGDREIAIVDAAMYRQLVKAAGRATLDRAKLEGVSPRRKSRAAMSTIDRDPEVANFVRGLLPNYPTIAQLRDACRERFGEARTPSATRVTIFRQRAT